MQKKMINTPATKVLDNKKVNQALEWLFDKLPVQFENNDEDEDEGGYEICKCAEMTLPKGMMNTIVHHFHRLSMEGHEAIRVRDMGTHFERKFFFILNEGEEAGEVFSFAVTTKGRSAKAEYRFYYAKWGE